MITTKLLAGAVGLLLATQAHSATIVQNGSFETDPGVAGYNGGSYPSMNWDIWASLPGWFSDAAANDTSRGIEVQSAATLPDIDAQDGAYYVELDSNNNTSMWQNINLSAGSYVLSFFYSPRMADSATNDIAYEITGLLSGLIGGPSVTTAVGQWTEVKLSFLVPTDATYTLRFSAGGTNDSLGGLIDNVSVSPVPVPAAGLMLLGGLGGLAALRRRKRA